MQAEARRRAVVRGGQQQRSGKQNVEAVANGVLVDLPDIGRGLARELAGEDGEAGKAAAFYAATFPESEVERANAAPGDRARIQSELNLALDGLEEREVLPRIQAVVPAGPGYVGT